MVHHHFAHYLDVKFHNKSRILRTISAGPVTRVDLARITGLSPATITTLVKELLAAGLVVETQALESMGGRPPILLEFNPDARRAIGLSVDSKRIQAAVVNLAGAIVHLREESLHSTDPQQLLPQVANLVRTLVAEAGLEWDWVAGVGVAVPGIVDPKQGVVRLSTVLGWREVPLGPELSALLGKPVLVQRNGNAAALAEAYFGKSEIQPNLLYLRLSSGIGAALVAGGSVYTGTTGRAGEVGHMVLDPDGPLCRCGNRGCLEALASARAITGRALEQIQAGRGRRMLELAGGDPEALTVAHVIQAAQEGDPEAGALLEEAGRWIGLAIAGLVNFTDIHAVVLDGELSQAGETLLQPVRETAMKAVLPSDGARLQIWPSSLWPRAGVIGAATLIIEEVLRFMETEVKPRKRSRSPLPDPA